MMGFGDYGGMMNGGWGLFGIAGGIFWIVLLADLILLGMWLWRELQKR